MPLLPRLYSISSSKKYSKEFPTNVEIKKEDSNLKIDSTILLNQIRTIDKGRLIKRLGSLNNFIMNRVNLALKISLELEWLSRTINSWGYFF